MTNFRAIAGPGAVALVLVLVSFTAGALWRNRVITDRPNNPERGTQQAPSLSAAVAAPAMPAPAPQAQPLRSREKLETALLPLLKDSVSIPAEVGLVLGGGGGMTVVDDTIIVADQDGRFAIARDKGRRIEKLALPQLPNNAADYEKLAAPPREITPGSVVNIGFVVHDVEIRREADGFRLLASYEKFLTELKTTALAVSAIYLSKDFAPLGSWDGIYQSQPLRTEWYSGIAGGGRMLVRGDTLLLTVGDYNQDNVFMRSELEAQNPDSDFGKIVSIDLRTKLKTIVSMGHRNPQGLAMTASGTIYSTEHGPRGGDLLTRVEPGANFGWPIVTPGTHYLSYRWPNRDADTGAKVFTKPTYAWIPSIGVSNLIEVAGFDRIWDRDLLVQSLKARSLYRLRLDGDNRVVYSEPIWIGERLRDIGSLSDGTLVSLTDSGKLIFLSVDAEKLATDKREWPLPSHAPQAGLSGLPLTR